MIRKIFIISFFLSSCAAPPQFYPETISSIWSSISNSSSIEVTEDMIESNPYSFVRVNIGRRSATLSLFKVKEDIFQWIGRDGVRIHTYNGKITYTEGLDRNITVRNPKSISFEDTYVLYVDYLDPTASMVPEISTIEAINFNQSSTIYFINAESKKIRFNKTLEIGIDDKGYVVYSEEKIHPFLPKVRMDYFYKF